MPESVRDDVREDVVDASEVVLVPTAFDDPLVTRMLAALDAELDERYGDEGIPAPVHRAQDYAPPTGTFLVATVAGEPVACGALRAGPWPGTAEVKRMWVAPHTRGRRIAEQVLAALLDTARAQGAATAVLETGVAQPEAMRLYERLGWRPRESYGHYRDAPLSRCFELDL